jgi:hypothetical protein
LSVDDQEIVGDEVELVDDGLDHLIKVILERPTVDSKDPGDEITKMDKEKPSDLSSELFESAF